MKFITLIFFLLFSATINSAETHFTTPDVSAGYRAIMRKANDNKSLMNSDYLRRKIKSKIALQSSGGSLNSKQPTVANSVLIGDGTNIDGDLIINIEVNGNTYASGE